MLFMEYIELHGDVNEETLNKVKSALESDEKDLCFLINSYGGSLPIGLEIFDLLSTTPKEKHTLYAKCSGNVASSATLILCGIPRENRSATKNTCFLIHNPLVSLYGTQNLKEIKALTNTMETANEQIKGIYRARTSMDDALMDALMTSETEFYADKAQEYGLIGNVEVMQNKAHNIYNNNKKVFKKNMKKSFLNMLTNRLVKALLNEAYKAEDGTELEISAIEVGGTCSADGVFVVEGYTITVEGGIITDVIAPQEEVVETTETTIENEGEGETTEETIEEVATETAEQVEQVVEETIVEEGEVDATEVAEVVKEIVEGELAELAELKELVEKCGGKDKLKALANVKHNAKVFNVANKSVANKGGRSIAELMAMKKK